MFMSQQLLAELGAAWDRQDVEGVLACFAQDGIYHDTSGDHPLGTTYQGHAAIREALVALFSAFPGARLQSIGQPLIGPDGRAASEWVFEYTDVHGQLVHLHGSDFFLIEGGKVKVKNAYMKSYSAS